MEMQIVHSFSLQIKYKRPDAASRPLVFYAGFFGVAVDVLRMTSIKTQKTRFA